jgi:chemotaxis protein methyltransferase CheR
MKEIYQPVTDLLQRAYGIDVSTYDASFLGKSIHKRITETQCLSTEAYCMFLEQNDGEAKRLLDSLRIGYSEFFRNPLTFAVLERIVLPGMVLQKKNNSRKELRVWSAACAAGQEAYSLAMLLEEFENGSSGKLSYRIFATDHDESRVREAQKGIFTEAALNNVHLKRLRQWFAKQGETYAVKPGLKENIIFRCSICRMGS